MPMCQFNVEPEQLATFEWRSSVCRSLEVVDVIIGNETLLNESEEDRSIAVQEFAPRSFN
jgi:hypothetical protein